MNVHREKIRRITIDERLDSDLIRILVSELGKEVHEGELVDDTIWIDEVSVLVTKYRVRPHQRRRRIVNWLDLLEEWNVPKNLWPRWEGLAEGQVYLQGAYILRKDDDSIKLLRDPSRSHMVRVDLVPHMKNHRDRLYNKLLLRRAKLA